MGIIQKQAVLALCSVALVALSTSAFAGPKHLWNAAQNAQSQEMLPTVVNDERYPVYNESQTGTRAGKRSREAATTPSLFGAFGGGSLVAEARSHLGTNPTGRSSLWCGAFMDMVLKKTGHAGGGNLARAYASYGTRVAGPQVGAIAVMARGGGGHVGVVSGVDANGNPIIISGNHNHTVAEAVYPRGRIIAYVMPGG
ncbi:MAG: TIGR02594 family protein [Hyphomicrobiales bacterium]